MGGMVWSARELYYSHITLIRVGYDAPAWFCILVLVSLSLVVAEIWGEHSPQKLALFLSLGECTWE